MNTIGIIEVKKEILSNEQVPVTGNFVLPVLDSRASGGNVGLCIHIDAFDAMDLDSQMEHVRSWIAAANTVSSLPLQDQYPLGFHLGTCLIFALEGHRLYNAFSQGDRKLRTLTISIERACTRIVETEMSKYDELFSSDLRVARNSL